MKTNYVTLSKIIFDLMNNQISNDDKIKCSEEIFKYISKNLFDKKFYFNDDICGYNFIINASSQLKINIKPLDKTNKIRIDFKCSFKNKDEIMSILYSFTSVVSKV